MNDRFETSKKELHRYDHNYQTHKPHHHIDTRFTQEFDNL